MPAHNPKLKRELDKLQVPEVYRPTPGRHIEASLKAEMAANVLNAIADGLSLRTACKQPDTPSAVTFLDWVARDEELLKQYQCARIANAEMMASNVLDTALACTSETAHADRVAIGAYQWLAGKMAPKIYGDKLEVDVQHKLTLENLIIQAFTQLKSEPAPVIDVEHTEVASGAEPTTSKG